MENRTLSRRQRYTVEALQDAYMDLLNIKPFNQITIIELCELADINRTTFYRYYKDMDDLREQTIADLFQQIFSVLRLHKESQLISARAQILKALNITIKKRKVCRQLLCNQTDMAEQALETNLTLIKDTIMSTGCNEDEGMLCYSYICGGLARLWIRWIEQDFATPKEKVALMIEEMLISYYNMMENGFILLQP